MISSLRGKLQTMFDSKKYWNDRYNAGKHSGLGSYGRLAKYKADTINKFIKDKKIKSVLEYGCGDGNNLSLIKCDSITGLDVATNAIERCKNLMPLNTFHVVDDVDLNTLSFELVLSLDVIYHLVEDEVYNDYISNLCKMSSKYIIVYSANFEGGEYCQHVRPRKFTEHPLLKSEYKLIKSIKNKYHSNNDTEGSFSDWYIYEKL